jgi:molybdopterin synthase catalytic subunit
MANPVCDVLLTETELRVPAGARDSSAGAIVEFRGVVRGLESGREIVGLEYEANRSMAEHQLRLLAARAVEEFGLKLFILHHRIGFVPTGEASLFLRVAAQNRDAAFAASQWTVEELKKQVPIWKKARFRSDEAQKESGREPHPVGQR